MRFRDPRFSFLVALAGVLLGVGVLPAQTVRRDITTLTATELREYRDAFRELQNNGEFARLAGFHGCPDYYCHNDTRIFLPWHRAYCLEFEKALKKVNSSLALHYWNWTSNASIQNGIPAAFTEVQYVSGGTTYPNPLRRFRYQCGGRNQFTVRFPGQPFLLGNLRTQVNNALNRTTYNGFNANSVSPVGIQAPHGGLHTWVGGDMGDTEWAAFDPLFWAHHSNVDRQWARWRDSANGADPSATIQALGLTPFGVKVSDMLNYHTLGYSYDQLTTVALTGVKIPAKGSIKFENFRLPPPGTPVWLSVHDMPAHPSKSFRVYVFVDQPNATVDDVRASNPNFAGYFGIFGGRRKTVAKDEKHAEAAQNQRVVDLTAALRPAIEKRAAASTVTVTIVATNTDGEVVPLSELPFDRVSLETGEKREEGAEKDASARHPKDESDTTSKGSATPIEGATVLTDSSGKPRRLEEFTGKPTVVVFFMGFGCEHCVKRLDTLATAMAKSKAQVVCVSADANVGVDRARTLPFVFLADPRHTTFRKYACFDRRPLHGTFLLDERGKVVWKEVGASPLANLDGLLGALDELAPGKKDG